MARETCKSRPPGSAWYPCHRAADHVGVDDLLYALMQLPRDATLDSNLRFFGVWFGLGLAVWWLVPR